MVVPAVPGASTSFMGAYAVPYNFATGGKQYLFNRSWRLDIGVIGGVSAISYTKLKTVFEIEKTNFSAANTFKIQVYNFSDFTRMAFLDVTLYQLAFSVGYAGLLFPLTIGDILTVRHERKGPDIVTTFEGGESIVKLTESVCNFGVPAGTDVTTVIAQLTSLMGLVLGPIIGLKPFIYSRGATFTGSCKSNLDSILKTMGLTWSVQNLVVQIHPNGVPVGTQGSVVSTATGMVGAANLGLGTGSDSICTFTSLINPLYQPGSLVTIKGRDVITPAVIKTAKFEGDTHDSKWTVKCECTNPSAVG